MNPDTGELKNTNPETFIVDEEETKFADEQTGPAIGMITPGSNNDEVDISWMNRSQRRKLMRDFKLQLVKQDKGMKTDSAEELKRRKKFRKKMK